MKLFTEDQVAKLTEAAFVAGLNNNAFIFGLEFEKLTPIELPTDEEIKEKISENIPNDEIDKYTAIFYFTKGAKYVIKKIQGGDK